MMEPPYGDSTTAAVPMRTRGTAPDRTSACLVVIGGTDRGTTHVLQSGRTTLGRELDNTVVLHESAVSRHHCEIRVDDGTGVVCDLGSTNGTFLNGETIPPGEAVELESGDVIETGSFHLRFLWSDEIEADHHRSMFDLAHRDALTGLSNRAYLMRHMEQALTLSRIESRPLTLVMVDVDHFKSVNDQYGHLAGDEVLRDIGAIIAARVRRGDCAARFGGEEMCLVLHDADRADGHAVAEGLRLAMERTSFVADGKVISVTASFGVAELTDHMAGAADLVRAADLCLYAAKSGGRNRTIS